MAISVEFQKTLNELVDEQEIGKTELARLITIDYRSFSNALHYGIIPSPHSLSKLADYFNLSIPYLLGETDNEYFIKAKVPTDFHHRLELLRKERNISYYRLAADCHFDKSCISKWFKNKHIPTWETLEIIADYFNVSIDYLLGRTDDR